MDQLFTLLEQAEGIACDSRCVRPGYIFVAIKGRAKNGNDYARDAEARGAIAIITDQQAPSVKVPVITTPNARAALAQLADRFYGHPSKNMAVIGVTGTNGKTTVTYMIDHILRQSGLKTGLIGTVKIDTGRHSFPSTLTTPDAVSLQKYLAEMKANGVTHAAMEVSAQGVEMHRVDNINFSCGIITNISPDHLDFHGDFDHYVAAKKQFIHLLNGPLIINICDRYCRDITAGFAGRLITAGVDADADITAHMRSTSAYGSRFDLFTTGGHLPAAAITVNLPVPGYHNIENALLAAAAALMNGIPAETIAAALSCFKCVERRMNVFQLNRRTIIDDTALNPGSLDAVLSSLPAFNCPNIVVVNAIRGNRGSAINRINAATLAAWQQRLKFSLTITSSIGNVTGSDTVTLDEKISFLGSLENAQSRYTYFSDLQAALKSALNESHPGDLIALLGAQGMDDGRKILTDLALASECHTDVISPSVMAEQLLGV